MDGPLAIFNTKLTLGTIHLRRRQIFTIFDPYPPTIGIPAKCLWRGFLILTYCDLSTIGTWGHPSPLRHADVLNGWSLMLFQSHRCKIVWFVIFWMWIEWESFVNHFCNIQICSIIPLHPMRHFWSSIECPRPERNLWWNFSIYWLN